MGRWCVHAEMAWSEGDQWALTVDLPAGKHEFKIAVGSKRGEQVEWEHGHNRVVEVRGQSLHLGRCHDMWAPFVSSAMGHGHI